MAFAVTQSSVDDRWVDENAERFRFASKILPGYKSIEDLVPGLYLKGNSTGVMRDARVHRRVDGRVLSPPCLPRHGG